MAASFQKLLHVRPGLFSTRPPTAVATLFGRVCFFVLGGMCTFVGITGITEFWYFGK